MQHMTVRKIPADLALALEAEKDRRRQSLNQTVIDLLRQSLGLVAEQRRSNGLAALAGRWTAEEHERFEEATAPTREIDSELWR